MARPRNNLNDRPSEYIEKNFLSENPEGLAPCATVPGIDDVVVAKEIPKMRKVVFFNGKDPGQMLEFHYHSKTHPLHHYKLYHGLEYLLSEEIISHLEDCGEKIYGYRKGPSGHPEMYVSGMKFFYRCQSVKGK